MFQSCFRVVSEIERRRNLLLRRIEESVLERRRKMALLTKRDHSFSAIMRWSICLFEKYL